MKETGLEGRGKGRRGIGVVIRGRLERENRAEGW